MIRALREHWPEYLIESALLGLFMISAGAFTTLLLHPASPIARALPNQFLGRALIGLAMGGTAAALIHSPWGKRSGAHMNPSVTLAYLRLGKVQPWDAVFYVIAQFAGGFAGLALLASLIGPQLANPSVRYVLTLPGAHGQAIAFVAEFAISFMLFTTVLYASNTPGVGRWTGIFAALLVTIYITLEAPFSGMSMNPARSFSSAMVAQLFDALWIYLTAPVLAMQLAAALFRRSHRFVYCAKLHHHNNARCIFNCAFGQLADLEAVNAELEAKLGAIGFTKDSAN